MTASTACLAGLCALLGATGLDAQRSEPEVEKDSVQLAVTINAIYDDSDSSVHQVALFAEALPPTIVNGRRFKNVQELMWKRYKISAGHPDVVHDSDLPRTYVLLAQKIKCLNQLGSDQDSLPRKVLIPSIPRRALSRPGLHNPYNLLPIIAKPRLVDETTAAGECGQVLPGAAFAENWDITQTDSSPASHLVQLQIWLNEDEYARLYGDVGEVLESPFQSRIVFQSMTLNHAIGADSGAVDHILLPGTFQGQLKTALESRSARRTVPLYILDSGWPDEQSRTASVTALKAIFAQVRRDLRLPQKKWSKLEPFKAPSDSHSVHIAEALKDLVALDPHRMVQVIFLPTTLEQGGGELLTELVYLHHIIQIKNAARAYAGEGIADTMPVDEKIRQRQRNDAQNTVAQFPKKVNSGAFVTDKAILEGLLWVAQHVAERNKTFFFVNMSWTVSTNGIPIAYPSPLWGLQVAAAGNAAGMNIFDPAHAIDFASRSARAGSDVMAVMTMDNAGSRRCGSSEIVADSLNNILAVGYDGWVGNACGTSYAAPRVAWFLAVDEVFRDEAADPNKRSGELLARLDKMKPRRRLEDLLFAPPGFIHIKH